jgi:hypothetical protein
MIAITDSIIPEEFICPLTNSIMKYPLMTRDGRSFERSEIIKWITTKFGPTCPITMKPLHVKDLIPNHKLRNKIQAWREQHGEIIKPHPMDSETIHEDEVLQAIALALTSHRQEKKSSFFGRFKKGRE